MAKVRGPSTRVVIHRAKFEKLTLAVADGLAEFGKAVIEDAHPPDAAPYGEGLVTRGGVLMYLAGRKVSGWSQDGRQPRPPRAARVTGQKIIGVAGFGFPARFQERGTVRQPARPFLWPAVGRMMPRATAIIGRIVRPHLRNL